MANPELDYWMDLNSRHLILGANFRGTVSFLSETRGGQHLSTVTRQTRQQGDHDLTSPQPISDTVIMTKPQLFVREVWELLFFLPCEPLKFVSASALHHTPPYHHISWHVLI